MSISEKGVGEQLSQIPVREMQNATDRDRLIRALADGEVKPVTLEKTFVPANEISRYVIVEHLVKDPVLHSGAHIHTELGSHVLFEDAQRNFRDKVFNEKTENSGMYELRELLLVGKFSSGELKFDKDGNLDMTTGISLDYALSLPGRSYNLSSSRDPYSPVTIQEKVFALVDSSNQTVQLYDSSLNKVELSDFWKKGEGPSINGVKMVPKDIEDIDLLPKQTNGQSKGVKM